jgi:hypothetical protein
MTSLARRGALWADSFEVGYALSSILHYVSDTALLSLLHRAWT